MRVMLYSKRGCWNPPFLTVLRIMDVDAPKQRDLLYLFDHCGFQIAASVAQPEEEKNLKQSQIF